jgi:phosphatidylglycerophosphatase A
MSPSPDAAKETTSPVPAKQSPPRAALLFATAFGLGYLPLAPGTWGSLAGVGLTWGLQQLAGALILEAGREGAWVLPPPLPVAFFLNCFAALLVAGVGDWAATRCAIFAGKTDPQFAVIDEVSGQQLTFICGLGWTAALNWKYCLLGFILFRVFDIWKPYPANRAESLPGGWGIMADDWVAGLYAAACLWLARGIGI